MDQSGAVITTKENILFECELQLKTAEQRREQQTDFRRIGTLNQGGVRSKPLHQSSESLLTAAGTRELKSSDRLLGPD